MANFSLPQTKYAQNLKPYNGEVPSYVKVADGYARKAGLAVARLHDLRKDFDDIVLVYSGTKAQISLFALRHDEEKSIAWPVTPLRPTVLPLKQFSPGRRNDSASVFKIRNGLYSLQIKLDRPRSMSAVSGDVECFDFNDGSSWGFVSYLGRKADLIALKLADEDMFPDDSTEMGRLTGGHVNQQQVGGYMLTLEETKRLHDGRWICRKYPQKIEQAAEAKRGEELSNFSDPSGWLESMEDIICSAVRAVLSANRAKTTSGAEYVADPAELRSIQEAIEMLAQRLRGVSVTVHGAVGTREAADRERAASAAHDPRFQAFMQVALGAPSARRARK